MEGSQMLRILCYEKCYNKLKIPKEDGENTDRIMGKGQIQVSSPLDMCQGFFPVFFCHFYPILFPKEFAFSLFFS